MDLVGIYTDDLHPKCTRYIKLKVNKSLLISGNDNKLDSVGGRGACNYIDDFVWTIQGKFDAKKDGKLLLIHFSRHDYLGYYSFIP